MREGPEQTQLGRPSVCLMPGFGLGVAEHLGLGLEGLAEPPCPLCATLRLPALPPALSGTRGQNMATAHLRLLQAQPRAVSLTRPKASRRWDLPPSSAAPLSQTGDPSKAWGASPRDLEVSQADVALVPSVKPMSSLIPLFTQPTGCPFCVGLRVWLGTQPPIPRTDEAPQLGGRCARVLAPASPVVCPRAVSPVSAVMAGHANDTF